jgi:hypothetical protein
MPDISMCSNDETCLAKRLCYRSTASGTKPTEPVQAYSLFEPHKGTECRGFSPLYDRRYERTKTVRAALAKQEKTND